MKTSNKFTLLRLILAPVIFVIYYLPIWFKAQDGSWFSILSICLCIPVLAFAEFTDYLDGHFARKNNEVSDFGKMFDPFADVFLHLSMFAAFCFGGYMPIVLYVLILYREFSQNFLRMVAAKSGVAIAARKGGKLKTVFYVASCFMVLIVEGLKRTGLAALWNFSSGTLDILKYVCWGFFAVCVILSYASFIDYLKNFGGFLKDQAN